MYVWRDEKEHNYRYRHLELSTLNEQCWLMRWHSSRAKIRIADSKVVGIYCDISKGDTPEGSSRKIKRQALFLFQAFRCGGHTPPQVVGWVRARMLVKTSESHACPAGDSAQSNPGRCHTEIHYLIKNVLRTLLSIANLVVPLALPRRTTLEDNYPTVCPWTMRCRL